MSSSRQSSVELCVLALYEGGFLQGNGDRINDLLEHHKSIHREEIKEAVMFGDCRGKISAYVVTERYYNETYGGNSEQ